MNEMRPGCVVHASRLRCCFPSVRRERINVVHCCLYSLPFGGSLLSNWHPSLLRLLHLASAFPFALAADLLVMGHAKSRVGG